MPMSHRIPVTFSLKFMKYIKQVQMLYSVYINRVAPSRWRLFVQLPTSIFVSNMLYRFLSSVVLVHLVMHHFRARFTIQALYRERTYISLGVSSKGVGRDYGP